MKVQLVWTMDIVLDSVRVVLRCVQVCTPDEAGKTILVVHHDLSTVEDYFDKVILLNQRLIAFGDTETTFTQSNISKAYGPQLTILHKTGLV